MAGYLLNILETIAFPSDHVPPVINKDFLLNITYTFILFCFIILS